VKRICSYKQALLIATYLDRIEAAVHNLKLVAEVCSEEQQHVVEGSGKQQEAEEERLVQ